MPETGPASDVISCPACGRTLGVPRTLHGVRVQCPECRAYFQAPVRDAAGRLTLAQLLPPAAARGRPDPLLWLPAFGLLFCGVAGLVANGVLGLLFLVDPAGGEGWLRGQVANLRQAGWFADDPQVEQDRLDAERVSAARRVLAWALPAGFGASGLALVGGLSIALRWNRRLAQLGCVAAILNVPHLCCLPGAVAGVWGLLMLASQDGRDHFAR